MAEEPVIDDLLDEENEEQQHNYEPSKGCV